MQQQTLAVSCSLSSVGNIMSCDVARRTISSTRNAAAVAGARKLCTSRPRRNRPPPILHPSSFLYQPEIPSPNSSGIKRKSPGHTPDGEQSRDVADVADQKRARRGVTEAVAKPEIISLRPVGTSSLAVFARKAWNSATITADGLVGSFELHRHNQSQDRCAADSMRDRSILVQSSAHAAKVANLLPHDARHRKDTLFNLEKASTGEWGEDVLVGAELDHQSVCIGDEFEICRPQEKKSLLDRAFDLVFAPRQPPRLVVNSPRLPCACLDTKFGASVRAVSAKHGLAGFFCRVLVPGEVHTGDILELRRRPHPQWTLQRVSGLVYGGEVGEKYPYDPDSRKPTAEERAELHVLLTCPELAHQWKSAILQILQSP